MGWQAGLISLAGRRELVRAVLNALPTYLLMALKVPKQFIKELDKIRRKFLWAGNQKLHGGKCKLSWARILRPLDRGGLGIHDLEKFGRALRLRWLWQEWKTPDKPWHGSELPVDQVDRALFAAATAVTVGDGRTVKFWTDSWLHGIAPVALFPNLHKHSKRRNRAVVDALQDSKWVDDVNYNWTTKLMSEYVLLSGLVTELDNDRDVTQ